MYFDKPGKVIIGAGTFHSVKKSFDGYDTALVNQTDGGLRGQKSKKGTIAPLEWLKYLRNIQLHNQ